MPEVGVESRDAMSRVCSTVQVIADSCVAPRAHEHAPIRGVARVRCHLQHGVPESDH
jgi:hypothetical protein